MAKVKTPETTMAMLHYLLPDAHIEEHPSGELVIYTGLAIGPEGPDGSLVEWEAPG